MKIELKRVTYNARLSQETAAYAADIWVDGVKRGDVTNDGHGGADRINPPALGEEINAYAKTLPPVANPWGEPLENCAELLLGDLLSDWLAARDLKRLFKTKVVFSRDGKIYTCQPGPMSVRQQESKGTVFLNGLPFNEAVTIYRKGTEA